PSRPKRRRRARCTLPEPSRSASAAQPGAPSVPRQNRPGRHVVQPPAAGPTIPTPWGTTHLAALSAPPRALRRIFIAFSTPPHPDARNDVLAGQRAYPPLLACVAEVVHYNT